MHRYSQEEIAFLQDYIPGHTHADLTAMFNERFGLNLGVNQITAACKNRKLNNGLGGHFPKGHTPFNKGMKGWQAGGKAKSTQFKHGQMPTNHRPVGSERINVDGYVEIKVEEPKKWRAKHVVLWEQFNGPVPRGCAVVFSDKDKTNITIENLMLLSRGHLAVMNKKRLFSSCRELTESGKIIADIHMKIASVRKRKAAI